METQSTASSMMTIPARLEGSVNHIPRDTLGGVTVDRIDDRLVGITLPPGARITSLLALQVRKELIAVFNDQPAGLLLHLAGVMAIDRDATALKARAVTVTALAIVGRTPVDRVMAHRLLGMTSPQCPSRYFADPPEAIEWLGSRTVASA
jgi:hypothetical protein